MSPFWSTGSTPAWEVVLVDLTFRDVRLRGWRRLCGWLSFVLACGAGLWANVGIASLRDRQVGWLPSVLAGVAVGVVWNYAVTSVYTSRQ